MAIDVELKTLKQNNTSWPLTFKASNRFPIVANRVFATLENAQAYINDTAADASAYPGIVLAVVQDDIAKNNGVYYVQSVAMTEGESGVLVKVGGTETETATNYSEAKELSKTLVVGQLIKVAEAQEIEETIEGSVVKNTYQAGFYIVEGAGVISALATSTGSDDEVGALKTRVASLETGKVDKVEGSRLMTDAEGTKLKGIAEGAEVNYVQSVGDNLKVESGKLTVDLSSKVDKTDYDKKVGEIDANILTKADLTEFTTHTANTSLHVTSEEKGIWNTAEGNAKAYTDTKISELDSKYDVLGAAASAETAAKAYADGLASNYDAAGSAASALTEAKAYVDGKVDGKFDTVGSAASALTEAKAYADGLASNYDAAGSAASALTDAKKYTDDEISKLSYDENGAAASALTEAKAYVDGKVDGKFDTVGSAASALTEAKAYADGLASNYDAAGSAASALTEAKKYTDDEITIAFNNFATAVTSDEVVNTYKELIDYAASHGAEFTELVGEVTDINGRVEDLEKINHDAYITADEEVLSDAKAYADGLASNYDAAGSAASALTEAKAYVDTISADTRLSALEGINHDAYIAADEALENKLQGNINTLSSGLSDEVSARESLAAIVGTPDEGDTESVMTKLAALAEGKLNASATINGQGFVDGAAVIDAGDIALESAIMSDNGEGGSVEQYAASSSIHAVLQSLNNRITAAVSGGLTSVSAGSGIEVSGVIGNSQSVSIKVSAADNNAVVLNTDGIYVEQIMVDGNDTEE